MLKTPSQELYINFRKKHQQKNNDWKPDHTTAYNKTPNCI